MKRLLTLCVVTLLTSSWAFAGEQYLGTWRASSKELLTISKDGDEYRAAFFRKNVKFEYEKVAFPATFADGILLIAGDQGNVGARYDPTKDLLMLGGVKAFEKLNEEQASAKLAELERKLQAQ